jgi:OmpA-OmpF porin, OOP family
MMPASPFGRAALITLVALCGIGGAHAQTQPPAPLSLDQLAPQGPRFSAHLNVACGDPKKTSCALVLPPIGAYAAKQGLTLTPSPSLGSVQSAQANVCPGTVPVAIGMADGFDSVRKLPACAASFDVIGQPLFPYFGYLIVANSVPVDTLDQLLSNLAPNAQFSVSDGASGSGGAVTFTNILATNPTYSHLIVTSSLDRAAALEAILHGHLGGYFVMDGPGSPVIAAIATATDGHGNPLFKFLSLDPGPGFYALKGTDGQPLYSQVTVNAGFMGFGSTTTVSTNAVMIVNHGWAHDPANATALGILEMAASQADAKIRAATLTPADWEGDSSMGHEANFVVVPQSTPTPQQLIGQLQPAKPPAPAAPVRTTATAPAPAPAAPVASTNLDIDFAINSADLPPTGMAALDSLGHALTSPQLAGYRFKIVGHTDTVGDPAANLVLSEQRAATVQAYLVAKYHVAIARLRVEGVGEGGLLVDTPPQTPNQSNRRVEIINLGNSP